MLTLVTPTSPDSDLGIFSEMRIHFIVVRWCYSFPIQVKQSFRKFNRVFVVMSAGGWMRLFFFSRSRLVLAPFRDTSYLCGRFFLRINGT